MGKIVCPKGHSETFSVGMSVSTAMYWQPRVDANGRVVNRNEDMNTTSTEYTCDVCGLPFVVAIQGGKQLEGKPISLEFPALLCPKGHENPPMNGERYGGDRQCAECGTRFYASIYQNENGYKWSVSEVIRIDSNDSNIVFLTK